MNICTYNYLWDPEVIVSSSEIWMLNCVCVLSRVWLFVTLWTVAPPGSSVHGIFPGKKTGVGCHFLFQGSSQPRDWTQLSCIGRKILYHWATWEALSYANGSQRSVLSNSSQWHRLEGGYSPYGRSHSKTPLSYFFIYLIGLFIDP